MNDKISIEQVEDALHRSGYLLENRLEKVLREHGFYVESNSAYLDSETTKSRELDQYATKGYALPSDPTEWLFSVLLIEAVNNPQPIAFFTKDSQISPLYREDVKAAGLPVKIPDPGSHRSWIFLPEYLAMDEYHHYCQGRIATQYCSFMQKKNELGKKEWMAYHDEAHFNGFRTLSLAVEYFKDLQYRGWTGSDVKTINIEFYYPVVVVQGDLLEIQVESGREHIQSTDHVQYRRTSILGMTEINYQIDVVTERYVPSLLSMIQSEMQCTIERIEKQYTQMHKAAARIIATAKKATNRDEIKAAFEFSSLLRTK